MPIVDTKSTPVSNSEATPPVLNRMTYAGGAVQRSCGKAEIAAADDDLSVYRLVSKIPSNASIISLKKYSDAITGGTDFDFGVRLSAGDAVAGVTTVTGGDNLFGDAVSLATADTTGTEIVFENNNIDNIGKPLFELLSLTTDPRVHYDIVAVSTTNGTVAGGLALDVLWTV
jgi:hypothetical protein